MNQKLQNLIVSSASVPVGIEGRIMVRVEKAAKRRIFEKAAVGSIFSVVFAVTLVVIGRMTLSETATLGFGQYLSLAFGNGGVVMYDWQNFAWTIIESAPVTGLALCLGATGMFIVALRWTGKTFSTFNKTAGTFAV